MPELTEPMPSAAQSMASAPEPVAERTPLRSLQDVVPFVLLRKAWRIYLSASGVRLEETVRGRRHGCVRAELPIAGLGPGGVKEALSRLLAHIPCRFRAVRVVVDDQWLRLFMVTPPHNARHPRDLHAAAAMRFATLYGGAAEAWKIEADWQAQRDFLACAIPRALEADLRAVAQTHRLTLLEIVPAFVAHWNQRPREQLAQAWFATADAALLTLGIQQQGRLQALRSIAIAKDSVKDSSQEPEWLPRQLQRQAQLLGVAPPAALICCGTPPASWGMQHCGPADRYRLLLTAPAPAPAAPAPAPKGADKKDQAQPQNKRSTMRIDFAPPSLLRRLRQMPGMGWCFGALGLLLCGASVFVILGLQQQAAILTSQTVQIEQQRQLYRAARARSPVAAITPARADAVNTAIAQLNLPWRDLFDALEAATVTAVPVALLSLDPDASKQRLKGQAEAANEAQMLAYIEQLKAQPFFVEVMLTRHEIKARDPQQPVAFQFEARWQGEPR